MYFILKILCRLTLHAYFKKISLDGFDKIPKNGPVIFVANHPSAFMDPIIAGVFGKRTMYFIAAGEYIGKGFKAWIFKNLLHMIPVYRPETMPEDTGKNSDMFEQSVKHLLKGKTLLVFPEGVSITEKKIKPLKTGVARIAAHLVDHPDYQNNLSIIPIGLNYSAPHQFRSYLHIQVGDPIHPEDYLNAENEQIDFDEIKTLTLAIENSLINVALHLDDEEEENHFYNVLEAFNKDLKAAYGEDDKLENEKHFQFQKGLINAVNYFNRTAPEKSKKYKEKLNSFLDELSDYKVVSRDLTESNFKPKVKLWAFVSGFPFYLIGLIFNVLPYQLTIFSHQKIKIKETFEGSMGIALGLVIFLVWYTTMILCLWYFTELSFYSFLFLGIGYLSGLYALIYRDAYKFFKRRKYSQNLLNKDLELKKRLQLSFNELRTEFNEFKKLYEEREINNFPNL